MCIAASRSIEQSVRLKEEETKTKKSVHGTEEERKREQGGEWGRENREGSGEERAGRGVGRESRMHDVASPDGGGRAVRVAGWIRVGH